MRLITEPEAREHPLGSFSGDLGALLAQLKATNPNLLGLALRGDALSGTFLVPPTDDEVTVLSVAALAPVAVSAPEQISLGGASLIQQPALPDNPTFDDLVAAVRQLQGLVT